MSEPDIDASELSEVVESLLHERNSEQTPPADYCISTTITAFFRLHGHDALVAAPPELDRYLVRRDRETWLTGGEYKETTVTYDRIYGTTGEVITYSPNEAAYLAAIITVNAEDLTTFELITDHRNEIYGGTGTPYAEYYQTETWLTVINTFEDAAAECAMLLAVPAIDSYVIGSTILVRYLGNDPFDSEPALHLGEIWLTEEIPNYGDTPISFFDQLEIRAGTYDYTIGGVVQVNMVRVKAEFTGPACRTTKRIQDPHSDPFTETIVKCIPFGVSEDGVLTLYSNPPCQRGFDFWRDELWQNRTATKPAICSSSAESGEDPDCSLS